MKKLNLFLMLVILGFGIMTQTAQAAEITQAPDLKGLTDRNARVALAPYAQVVPDDSYTFIGISHPSLATAHTSIGVAVEVLDMTTVPNNAAGRAAVFTVSAGETHRVFVVNQSHSTINLNNSSFTDTLTHIITTSDTSQYGNIQVTGIGTSPNKTTTTAKRPGDYRDGGNALSRADNVSQLAMWGVVYQSANGAGFALEFIGDMHDSSAGGVVNTSHKAGGQMLKGGAGPGRGIN